LRAFLRGVHQTLIKISKPDKTEEKKCAGEMNFSLLSITKREVPEKEGGWTWLRGLRCTWEEVL